MSQTTSGRSELEPKAPLRIESQSDFQQAIRIKYMKPVEGFYCKCYGKNFHGKCDPKFLVSKFMTSTSDIRYIKSSYTRQKWSVETLAAIPGEPQTPPISPLMSQAIPPSVTVPVPDGSRVLPENELEKLPYELVERLTHLCRMSYWPKERISSDKTLFQELEGELQPGFPKILESKDPHNPTAHLWLFPNPRMLVVVFRGVGSVGESMMDTSSSLSTVPTGQVHTGFLTQFRSLDPIIRAEIQSVRESFNSLVITGHGTGGALATICLPHFASMCPETKFSCVTFGSPRVGDSVFKEWYNSFQLEHDYRFVLEDDPMPMFPSSNRFVHSLDAICLRHDGRFELWPETVQPRWEIPFGSLVMYIVSVFVHMQWEYDDRFSHACKVATASAKRRGG